MDRDQAVEALELLRRVVVLIPAQERMARQ
jgi:hypothetical protein